LRQPASDRIRLAVANREREKAGTKRC